MDNEPVSKVALSASKKKGVICADKGWMGTLYFLLNSAVIL